MFALYLTSLALSAGVFGVAIRQMLQAEGYVPGFAAGLAAAVSAAMVYVTVQWLFMAFVQLLKPTRSPGPLFCDVLSHAAVLIFLPFILGMQVPWPHEMLLRVEPLLYLGTFAVVHAFFKLMAFFAAMRATPASRLHFALWTFGAAMALVAALFAGATWVHDVQALRPKLAPAADVREVDGVYCRAAEVMEGAVLASDLTATSGSAVTFRVAAPRDVDTQNFRAYFDAYFHGRNTTRYSTSVRFSDAQKNWVTLRIPAEFIPPDLRSFEIFWSSHDESTLRKLIGLRPVQTSNRSLWVSGPYVHAARPDDRPSFVIVSVEGLGSAHMSTFGYSIETTPALDSFVARSLAFSNTYTPYPASEPATWSLLTGTGPLVHRRFPRLDAPESADVETLAEILAREHYTTAAFTETGADQDALSFGSGFEDGFEYVDTRYDVESESDTELAGSHATLARAQQWIDRNRDVAFFVFIRLRELADLTVLPRHGEALFENDGRTVKQSYDGILRYLDRHLGAFLKHLRDQETRNYTVMTVTSPFAYDFYAGANQPGLSLTENTLRVPLIIQAPDLAPAKRTTFISLTDVMPTLLEFAKLNASIPLEGHSVLAEDFPYEPVSMLGDPLTMTLRTERYQFNWQSGLSAATLEPAAPDEVLGLLQISRKGTSYTTQNVASRNPKLVAEFRAKLMAYAGIQPQDSEEQP